MLKKISTDKAPAAIGPYSQGIIANGMLFASGQIPINPATGNVEGEDITAQAELVMKNVRYPSRLASTTPTVLFPAPGIPISTILSFIR